jgi:diaminopimelate epimerase
MALQASTTDRFWFGNSRILPSRATGILIASSAPAANIGVARGMAAPPMEVRTPAGPLHACTKDNVVLLTGPADLVAEGLFLL